MSITAQFAAYAAAFEKAYESDDWTCVEPFFAEHAVYDVGIAFAGHECFEGRSAILSYFKQVLDQFDRRFDSRELILLEGPFEQGNTVRIRGSATYRAAGVPDFVLVLDEIATYEGELIVHLEDRYSDEMKRESAEYIKAYGATLGI
ncbi:MAG: nuclear transport factor 2 family protein [Myxococcales bacterium]|nr:nuclear transport factor 2 family protein [Myxococcales bacterium]